MNEITTQLVMSSNADEAAAAVASKHIKAPVKTQSCKRKLEDSFEYILLNTSVNSPSVALAAYSKPTDLYLEDIKIEETNMEGEAEECSLEYYKEVSLADVKVSSSTHEVVDPLLGDEILHQGYEAACETSLKRKRKERVQHKCPECDYSSLKKRAMLLHRRIKHRKTNVVRASEEQRDESAVINAEVNKINSLAQPEMTNLDKSEEIDVINNTNERLLQSTETNTEDINKVDYLLKINFLKLTLKEQLEIKKLGPHQPTNVQIYQNGKTQNRFFSVEWFNKVEWLTVSESKKKFFCFYCLLFGGSGADVWTKTGYDNIKHLSVKIKVHESETAHIKNAVQFKLLGELGARLQVPEDSQDVLRYSNEVVNTNRHILGVILDCIKFCATHEVPLSKDDHRSSIFNRELFLSLVLLVAKVDDTLSKHIQEGSAFTSEQIQNELLDSIYQVYQDQLTKDINKANFVSVQVEKVADVTQKPHFALILRYMKEGVAVERLHSLIQVDEQTADGLSFAIKKELMPLNICCKLIAQTYDGTVTMRGPYGGVHTLVRDLFPHALFVHSYAHSFGTIIRQACSSVRLINTFFGNLFRFSQFFAIPSRQRELLHTECKRHKGAVENKWDSDQEIIRTVFSNQHALLACCETIRDGYGWNYQSIWEASQLADLLIAEGEFISLTGFFYVIMHHIDILHDAFKARRFCGDIMTALKRFETTIIDLMGSSTDEPHLLDLECKNAINEACGIIISELRERFEATDHLISFSVLDPQQTKKTGKLPHGHLQVLTCRYRMLINSKLTSEMKVFYKNLVFSGVNTPSALLNVLVENDLVGTFSEVCKLIEIALATPIELTGTKICLSTAEKLHKFMKTDMPSDKLNVLATLMVHKDLFDTMTDFNIRVIEHFATKGTGKSQFLYKI